MGSLAEHVRRQASQQKPQLSETEGNNWDVSVMETRARVAVTPANFLCNVEI